MICGDRFAIARDARKHIAVVGSKNWRVVRARHPGVSDSTFWRAVRAAKADLAADDMRTVAEQGVRLHVDPAGTPGGVAAAIPLRVDHWDAAHQQLFADVLALRQSALNADGSLRLPAVFDRSIRTRQMLITRSVKLRAQIYSLRSVRMFLEAVIDELKLESPDLQRRLCARLQQLGDRGGTKSSSTLPSTVGSRPKLRGQVALGRPSS